MFKQSVSGLPGPAEVTAVDFSLDCHSSGFSCMALFKYTSTQQVVFFSFWSSWTLKINCFVHALYLGFWIDIERDQCHIRSSFKSSSTLWIEYCNLIFLSVLVKALMLVASSCNSESHYLMVRVYHAHTRAHTFCLYASTNIDSFLLGKTTGKCILRSFRAIIVLFTFHTHLVSRCCVWEVPVSVSFFVGLALCFPFLPYRPHYLLQLQMTQRGMTSQCHHWSVLSLTPERERGQCCKKGLHLVHPVSFCHR